MVADKSHITICLGGATPLSDGLLASLANEEGRGEFKVRRLLKAYNEDAVLADCFYRLDNSVISIAFEFDGTDEGFVKGLGAYCENIKPDDIVRQDIIGSAPISYNNKVFPALKHELDNIVETISEYLNEENSVMNPC